MLYLLGFGMLFIAFIVIFFICYYEEKNSSIVSQNNSSAVTIQQFWGLFAHDVALPVMQRMARSANSVLLYPNTVFDITPTVYMQLPNSTLVYEFDTSKFGATVSISRLQRDFERAFKRFLSRYCNVSMTLPEIQNITFDVLPLQTGAYYLLIDFPSNSATLVQNHLQAQHQMRVQYAQQQYAQQQYTQQQCAQQQYAQQQYTQQQCAQQQNTQAPACNTQSTP